MGAARSRRSIKRAVHLDQARVRALAVPAILQAAKRVKHCFYSGVRVNRKNDTAVGIDAAAVPDAAAVGGRAVEQSIEREQARLRVSAVAAMAERMQLGLFSGFEVKRESGAVAVSSAV